MSDFLALCRSVRQECGVPGDGPVSVVGQKGVLLKLVNWTAKAWVDIQRKRRDWRFMKASHAGTLAIGKQEYNAADFGINKAVLGEIDRHSFYLGGDRLPLLFMDWNDWRAARHGINPKTTKPKKWTVNLAGNVLFDSVPDMAYAHTFDYRLAVQRLASNTDKPYLPDDYSDAIVALAVQYYADYEEIAALSRSAQIRHLDAMTDLESDQSPQVSFGPSRFGRAKDY